MPRDDIPEAVPDESEDKGPSAEQIGNAARKAILDALDLLEAESVPLARLLAMQAHKRPDLLLKAMGRFAPTKSHNDLLPSIQAMHLAALRALARNPPVLIEGQAEDDDWLA